MNTQHCGRVSMTCTLRSSLATLHATLKGASRKSPRQCTCPSADRSSRRGRPSTSWNFRPSHRRRYGHNELMRARLCTSCPRRMRRNARRATKSPSLPWPSGRASSTPATCQPRPTWTQRRSCYGQRRRRMSATAGGGKHSRGPSAAKRHA